MSDQNQGVEQKKKGVFKRRDIMFDRVMNSDSNRRGRITTDEALQYVLRICRSENYRERTLQDYERIWKWLFQVVTVEYIDELNPNHFREYIEVMLHKNRVSPSTVNIRLTALKAIFNRLHNEGIIENNPMAKIRKLKVDEKPLVVPTDQQLQRLFAVIDKSTFAGYRDYVAMLVMLYEGLRNNEIISLQVDDVDFANGVLLLPGSKNKNRKTRVVPLANRVKDELKALIAETQEYFGPEITFVFTNQFGAPLKDDYLRKRMHLYAQKVGLHKEFRCSPHTLRHVFATRFAKQNGDLRALQMILGHSDIKTTQIYVNYLQTDVKERYDAMSMFEKLNI